MPKIATDGVLQLWRLDLSWLLRWSDVVPSIFGLFKWQFEPEVILLRLVFALLAFVPRRSFWPSGACTPDHVTAWRWVQRYAPEMERRLCRQLKPTNDSWRVDETYIRVKVKWVYLYRAVDSTGATIDFLLSAKRDTVAASLVCSQASKDAAQCQEANV